MSPKRLSRGDYKVAWICPLEVEQIAAMEMLDEEHETLPQPRSDTSIYNLGSINNHNVVVAGLTRAGNCSAATVISQMKMTFPNLNYGLLVGIGGGVPVKTDHGMIRLGHVVVSEPTGTHSGTVQYDHGKAIDGEFQRKGSLGSPPTALLHAARELSVRRQRMDHDPIWKNTQRIDISRPHLRRFRFPGVTNDHLYPVDYQHLQAGVSCEEAGCDTKSCIERPIDGFDETFITVHRGTIASGELVIKDARKRDHLAREHGVLCFETEAAGASIDFPCMVIRGISDYCDSHKNNSWHGYAAAVAAAYARQLFFHMPFEEPPNTVTPIPGVFKLPFDLTGISAVPYFVTRQDELQQMHELLGGAAGRRIAILYGLGGMGKTQLAITYIKQYCAEYPVAIWLNASDEITLKQSFARTAEKIQRLESSPAYIDTTLQSRDLNEIWKAVKRWLEEPMNNRWIVTYDNYDDPSFDDDSIRGHPLHPNTTNIGTRFGDPEDGVDSKAFDIRPYLPTANHGSIIITSRSSAVNFASSIKIGKLKDLNDCLEILAQTSRRRNLKDDTSAIELAQRLDGLPVALATAGAYLDQVAMSCAEYLQLYHESWLQLHQEAPRLPSYDKMLYSTWGISYGRIQKQSPMAAMLLRQWAYFSNEDLWYELLKEADPRETAWLHELTTTKLNFHGTMRILCDHGLVEAASATGSLESAGYSVHGNGNDSLAMRRRPPTYKKTSPALDSTTATYKACGEILATLYSDQGRSQEAETLLKRALEAYKNARDPGHIATVMALNTINNLGNLYREQCRLKEAETMFIRVLRSDEEQLGFNYAVKLSTTSNLGTLYSDQGRFQEAEALIKRALEGYETTRGLDHILTLNTVHNLGAVYGRQGKHQEAEAYLKRALEGYEKAPKDKQMETFDTVTNLGNLYSHQGRLQEAEELLKRGLKGHEAIWGLDHILTLTTVHNLGKLYFRQGRHEEAEAMFKRAREGKEKAVGPHHTSTLDTVRNLGEFYSQRGQLQEAEVMYKQALEGYEKNFEATVGPTLNSALVTLEGLGDLYVKLDRVADAISCYERAQRGIEAGGFGCERQRDVVMGEDTDHHSGKKDKEITTSLRISDTDTREQKTCIRVHRTLARSWMLRTDSAPRPTRQGMGIWRDTDKGAAWEDAVGRRARWRPRTMRQWQEE
ncbi:hypothetical protein NLG97_g6542 [Lecanicillium saksenae]|uniref:Uncharacterized protein n=1 Tax=Lecanicillium saksenae TaxID=468837 RepID=A0ACC1QSG0_9HYPO|nr:hypothetical protein NLG97_g6542 [Lecanicillium saksenae]